MGRTLSVAAVQMSSQDDVAGNLRIAAQRIRDAALEGAKLVVLPSHFAFMGDARTKRAIAESLTAPGPILSMVGESAAKHRVHVVGNLAERSPDAERPHLSSVLFDPEGQIVAHYRKIHLFHTAQGISELSDTTPGTTSVTGPMGDSCLGLSVCYDVRFPELFRELVSAGAQLVALSGSFLMSTGKDHWRVLVRARAIENQVVMIAANQAGVHPGGRVSYGQSMIVDPWGDVIAQAGDEDPFALARVDLDALARVRSALPVLEHRRLSSRV